MSPLGEFQPPDVEEDRDAMAEAYFEQMEHNGYAVLSRDEWRQRLDSAATDGYAEGRKDEREDLQRLLAWSYSKLCRVSFSKQEDALALDEIKLILMGSA